MNYYLTVFKIAEIPLGYKILRSYQYYNKTQWYDRHSLINIQNENLQRLIQHCYETVPYYRNLFKANHLSPADISSIQDLSKLPILTKDIIKQNYNDLISRKINRIKYINNRTGGTAGEPLQYLVSRYDKELGNALLLRGWGFGSYRFGDKILLLSGSSLVGKTSRLKHFYKLLSNQVVCEVMLFDDNIIQKIIKLLEKKRPKFLRSYASYLYTLAKGLKSRGFNYDKFKGIFTTAEMMLPYQKKYIEDFFCCKVYEEYGAYDGSILANECKYGSIHISDERCYIEIVDDLGVPVKPGHAGHVVATSFYNLAMPFVRYKVGDIAAYSEEPCKCGRRLKILTKLYGRTSDVFRLEDGSLIPYISFVHLFSQIKGFEKYKFLQKSPNALLVKLEKSSEYTDADLELLQYILHRIFQDKINIYYEFGEITRSSSDKRSYYSK